MHLCGLCNFAIGWFINRCVQSPEQSETSECETCGKASSDALWICLICGHVGCGR